MSRIIALEFAALVLLTTACQSTSSESSPEASPSNAVEVTFLKVDGAIATPTTRRGIADLTAVVVSGLTPGSDYRVTVTLPRLDHGSMRSWLDATADADGRIDTRTTTPTRGTYTRPDADGLFWSMQIDADTPAPAAGWHVKVAAEGGDTEIASADLAMELVAPGIQIIPVEENGLVGRLYLPAGASDVPVPVVVVLPGSEGGLESTLFTSSALASRGYASLSLAWFGAPGLPQELVEIPLEYFEHAFAWLSKRPEVDASRLAVIGTSRGGELSLVLGARYPQVKAVVARVPSHYRWGGNPSGDDTGPSRPAFTHGGRGLPYLDSVGELDEVTLPDGTTAVVNTPAFRRGMDAATPSQIESATTRIERTRGPILLIGGGDDQLWPSCEYASQAMERLSAYKHAYQDESVCLPGAGHGVTGEPGFPTNEVAFEHPHMHVRIFAGGTPEANAAGQRIAWDRTIAFLERALRAKHP